MNLPTSYFPNTEYFTHLLKSHEVSICINEIFPKQTLRNRCVILNANGLQNLSIPVERESGHDTLTKNIRISYSEDWQKIHLRSIESAYRRTPYYEYYIDALESILLKNHTQLVDLNFELLQFLVAKTGLTCEVNLSKDSEKISREMNELVNPKLTSAFNGKSYLQTFTERFGFQNNLSILDLLFNEGPNAICVLEEGNIF
jgi:hypothetical protein